MFGTYYVHFPNGKPEVYPGLEEAFRREPRVASLLPGLEGKMTDNIFPMMMAKYMSGGLAALALAGAGLWLSAGRVPAAAGMAPALIASAPQFQVQKISTDMTGDPTVLMAGDTLRYTIQVNNNGGDIALQFGDIGRGTTDGTVHFVGSSRALKLRCSRFR